MSMSYDQWKLESPEEEQDRLSRRRDQPESSYTAHVFTIGWTSDTNEEIYQAEVRRNDKKIWRGHSTLHWINARRESQTKLYEYKSNEE